MRGKDASLSFEKRQQLGCRLEFCRSSMARQVLPDRGEDFFPMAERRPALQISARHPPEQGTSIAALSFARD